MLLRNINSLHPISDKDPCRENPCLNNGVCKRNGNNDFTCSCTEDYKGSRCEGRMTQDNEFLKVTVTRWYCGTFLVLTLCFISSKTKNNVKNILFVLIIVRIRQNNR